jgi:hypothetical protein
VNKNRIEKGTKNPQIFRNPSIRIRGSGLTWAKPSPDLTSSESGKETRGSPASTLGLTGSSSRIRASQRGCSMTARSPSGERRPSASRRVTTPLLRPVATPAAVLTRSLGRSGGDGGGEETRWLGLRGNRAVRRFCSSENRSPPSIADEQLTAS